MNKKGFTLMELLVVIVIIGILSVIIVPSVLKVNENINDELYNQKVGNIETAAEMYASNNPDIFNGATEVEIKVSELIKDNYLQVDSSKNTTNCTNTTITYANGETYNIDGCVINPKTKESMNDKTVVISKQAVGVVATLTEDGITTQDSQNATLVSKVCDGFTNGSFSGKYDTSDGKCTCKVVNGQTKLVKEGTNEEVSACIIVSNDSSGSVNNWLRYGSSEANWRVIGLYNIDGNISAKMITSSVIQ